VGTNNDKMSFYGVKNCLQCPFFPEFCTPARISTAGVEWAVVMWMFYGLTSVALLANCFDDCTTFAEDSSIVSDDGAGSIASPDEMLNGGENWSSAAMQQQHLDYVQLQTQQDVVSKGPKKSEIQLR
jgi:hypothetical protein